MASSSYATNNHQRCSLIPISKSMESFTHIDSISIDLPGASTDKNATKCEHFSIRKYVSERRQKDKKACWPFKLEKDMSEVPNDMLPPLDVPKFRWWRCQNCVPDLGSEATLAEKVIDDPGCKCKCDKTCTHMSRQSETAILVSDFQQTTNVSIKDTGKLDITIPPQTTKKGCDASLCTIDKEQKPDQVHTIIIKEVDLREAKRKNAQDTVPYQSKGNGSLATSMQECGGHEAVACQSYSKNTQFEDQVGDQDPMDAVVAHDSGMVGPIGGVPQAGQENGCPSEELDECDGLSSDSGDLSGDYCHVKKGGSHRRRSRKVRLLTDLLGKGENVGSDQMQKEDSPSLIVRDGTAKMDIASFAESQVAIHDNVKKFSHKRKRNLLSDPDYKQTDVKTPSKENENEPVLRGDAGNAKAIVGSQVEDDGPATMGLKTDMKNQWAIHKEQAVSVTVKRKKERNKTTENHFRGKFGEIGNEDGSAMFMFGQDASSGRGVDSFIFPTTKIEKSSVNNGKRKMPQQNYGGVSVTPGTNPEPSGGLFPRIDSGLMQTTPSTIWCFSTSDASLDNGPGVSLKSGLVAPKIDKGCTTQFGLASSFPWLEGAQKDHLVLRNAGTQHMEPNFPSTSGSDSFLGKGVHHPNDGTTYKGPKILSENQGYCLNKGDAYCFMPQVDISGASNSDKVTISQELSAFKQCRDGINNKASQQAIVDDIPMEIVELMAKNQYERSLDGTEKNKLLIGMSKSMDSGSVRVAKESKNRVLNLLQKDSIQNRQLNTGNPKSIVVGKDFRTPMRKVSENSSVDSDYPSVGPVKRTHTARHSEYPRDQEKSAKVRICVTDPTRNCTTLNGKVTEDISRNKPSDTCFHSLGAHGRTHLPRQSDQPVHLSPSMLPTHMPFMYNIPQKCGLHSNHTDIQIQSHWPRTPPKVEMNWNHDPKLFGFNAAYLEKPNMDFHLEAFGRPHAENPFGSRPLRREIENRFDSFDFRSNETIPAMHLLSLMHSGKSSGHNIDLGGNAKSTKRPSPSFPQEYHSEEFHGKRLNLYEASDPLKCPSGYRGTNFFPGRYHEHSTVPIAGTSVPLVQPEKIFAGDTEVTPCVPHKVRDKGKRKCSDMAGPSGGSTFGKPLANSADAGIKEKHDVYSRGNVPDSMIFFPHEENSGKANMDSDSSRRSIWPMKYGSKTEICVLNRNPADFSLPEAGNVYTIGRNDLKFGRSVQFQKKTGLIKLDADKGKSSVKLASGNRLPQHQLRC